MVKLGRDFSKNDDAVVEILSEILLTAIIVIAVGAIAVFLLASLDGQDNVRVDIKSISDTESNNLYFKHTGGEAIDVDKLEFMVSVNDTDYTLTPQNYSYDEWYLGDTIEISIPENVTTDTRLTSKIVHTGASLVIFDAKMYGTTGAYIPDTGNGNGGNGDNGEQQPPTADFDYSPENPTPDETIDFTDLSEPEGTIVGWSWDFGDGSTLSNQNPSHSYSSEGTYTVTLTVTDNDGNSDSTSKDVEVANLLYGQNIFFQKQNYGGYIPDGDYLEFEVTSGANQNDIQINGQPDPYEINKGNIIKFVMNGNQTSGEADIGIQGNDRQITRYDFNVEFYRNGNLIDTGQIDSINIHKAEIIESTLSYYSPPNLSETQFGDNGSNKNIISAWPQNDSEIIFYNITPHQDKKFRLEFRPSYGFINRFDADYIIK